MLGTADHTRGPAACAKGLGASRGLGLAALATLLAGLSGCDRSDLIETLGQVRPDSSDESGGTPAPNVTQVPFTVFSDDVGDKAGAERRVLFKTREAYQGFFGHAPPAAVAFPNEWAIFYAAGVKPSGGYRAGIRGLSVVDFGGERLLQAVTGLESPGRGCPVTDALTSPHVLVKFAAQTAGVFNVDFSRTDSAAPACGGNPCAAALCPPGSICVPDAADPSKPQCVPFAGCAAVKCSAGFHCEVHDVQCVRAPCPPVAACVPDKPRVTCGGIAARKCPGVGRCVDDPTDSCDPGNGGADCGGVCVCAVSVNCMTGHVLDPSPAVCGCVPQK